MASQETARFVLGIAGNVASVGLFLSPLPMLLSIRRNGSVGDNSPILFLAALLNGSVWLLYSLLQPNSLMLSLVNGSGVGVVLIYIIFFFYYSTSEKRRLIGFLFTSVAVAVGITAALAFTLVHPNKPIGAIGVVSAIAMYASPLAVMKTVVQTHNGELIQVSVSIASFINSAIWSTYALLSLDIFVAVPNIIGFVLSALQLILYACYHNQEGEHYKNPELP